MTKNSSNYYWVLHIGIFLYLVQMSRKFKGNGGGGGIFFYAAKQTLLILINKAALQNVVLLWIFVRCLFVCGCLF